MDLATIQSRVTSGYYRDMEGFIRDLTLVFDNCYQFNTKVMVRGCVGGYAVPNQHSLHLFIKKNNNNNHRKARFTSMQGGWKFCTSDGVDVMLKKLKTMKKKKKKKRARTRTKRRRMRRKPLYHNLR